MPGASGSPTPAAPRLPKRSPMNGDVLLDGSIAHLLQPVRAGPRRGPEGGGDSVGFVVSARLGMDADRALAHVVSWAGS